MSSLLCPICSQAVIKCEVKVSYWNKVIGTFESYLKAEAFVLDNKEKYLPCKIEFVYTCQRCRNEEIKSTRVLTNQLLPVF